MAEFNTSATLDVQVSPSSLRDARNTIESELGDVQVSASSTTGGGSRISGRERAMGRQLQSETNTHLEDNLDLNRERNDLLRQLVDITEKDAQTSRGPGGGLAGGALGLAIGGIGLGSMLLDSLGSKIGDAIPDLDPSDVVDSVKLTASDVIDSAVEINVGDTITTAATIAPAALIASAATITPDKVIEQLANVSPSDLTNTLAEVTPDDLVGTLAEVTPDDLTSQLAELSPGALISQMANISPGDLVDELATIQPLDLIVEKLTLAAGDIISGKITAQDILDRLVDPASLPDGTGVAAGAAGGIGAAGAAAAAKRYGLGSAIRGGASRAAGVTSPVITRGMVGLEPNEVPDLENGGTREVDMKSNKEWIRDVLSGPADPNASPGPGPDEWKTTPTDSTPYPTVDDSVPSTTEATVEQTNQFEINADTSDLEREARRRFDDLESRLSDLENAFSS